MVRIRLVVRKLLRLIVEPGKFCPSVDIQSLGIVLVVLLPPVVVSTQECGVVVVGYERKHITVLAFVLALAAGLRVVTLDRSRGMRWSITSRLPTLWCALLRS